AISAEHGDGFGDLRDALADHLPDDDDEAETEKAPKAMKVAIIGRPNAGKSTLVNALVGEERMLTGPEAGITRDSIAIDWTWKDHAFQLFDTAGLRRKARVDGKLEKLAVADALRAIQLDRKS